MFIFKINVKNHYSYQFNDCVHKFEFENLFYIFVVKDKNIFMLSDSICDKKKLYIIMKSHTS